MIIGITGSDGAGKGTVVELLVERGFTHYSSRSFIMAEIERQGLAASRNQMRLTANALRAQHGNAFVVRQAYQQAQAEGATDVVIESVRALAEAEYLREHGGALLAVDAPRELRFTRVQARRSESDQVEFATFVQQEELEKNDPDPNGMQKAQVMEQADYTIVNDSSLEDLRVKVDAFLKTIGI